jgi:diphthamide synthase (EF-2-diphthine--ammonia ligase)
MIFDSYELYTAYRNETAVTFQTNVTTEDGTYTFDVSNARITKFGAPSTEDGLTKVTVDYEGYNDATNTALKITRTAA